MINANKELLNSFFTSNLQYIVPFFQRTYVWDEDNWEILWEHISQIAQKTNGPHNDEHFIGTLITKQQVSERIDESKRDLIDGQQRLTTIALLLKAIATKATGQGDYIKLKDKANELLLFENSRGEKFLRIEHSRNDKEYFEAIMHDGDLSKLNNQEHKILKCYKFFKDKLKDFSDDQLENLRTIILSNVPVISMLLSDKDDEQEIFDTINSLGVKLTTGELLKNYIFKEKELQSLYESHWHDVFEEDEEQIEFWNKNKTSGRIIRTNIEILLYCYLIIKIRSDVKLEKLFIAYKNWLSGKSQDDKKDFLEELKRYATIYYNFPDSSELNEISFSQEQERFFHIIENLEITTVYPLILFIYDKLPIRQPVFNYLKS